MVCFCEEWNSKQCCYQFEESPFYNITACPDCIDNWDDIRCCANPTYATTDRCLCQDNNNYLGDYCCQFTNSHIKARCPLEVCDAPPAPIVIVPPTPPAPPAPEPPAPCECEEEEPSCPCALLNGGNCYGNNNNNTTLDGNSTTISHGSSYVKYEAHEMEAHNITSGHNTVLINHLHIDVAAAADGSNGTSSDLQTLINLSIASQGVSDEIVDKLRAEVRDEIRESGDN